MRVRDYRNLMKISQRLLCAVVLLLTTVCFAEDNQSITDGFLKKARDEHRWSGRVLGEFARATSTERLKTLLDDSDWYISYAAMIALVQKNEAKKQYLTKVFETADFTGRKYWPILDLLDMVGSTGDPAYLPRLKELLADPDVIPNTKGVVIGAISAIPGKQSWQILMEATNSDIPRVRAKVAIEISWRRWDEPAFDVLISLTKDKESSVRKMAAEALGRIGDPCVLAELIVLCEDEDIKVREIAAWALGNLRDKRATDSLQMLIKTSGKNTSIGMEAQEALRKISGGRRILSKKEAEQDRKIEKLYRRLLQTMCHQRAWNVVTEEARLQERAKIEQIVANMVEIYTQFPNVLVYRLRKACESAHNFESIPWTIGLLYQQAIEAMPKDAINWSAYIDDETEGSYFRYFAMEFANKEVELTPKLARIAVTKDLPLLIRCKALSTIGSIGKVTPECFEIILPLLSSPEERLIRTTIRALGSVGAKEVVGPLRKILKEEKRPVLRNAMHALADIEGSEAVTWLKDCLESSDKSIRNTAFNCLGNINSDSAKEILREKLLDPDPEIAGRAAIYLRPHLNPDGCKAVLAAIEKRRQMGFKPAPEMVRRLGRGSSKTGWDLLLIYLDAKESAYRTAAALALGSRPEYKKAIVVLQNRLKIEDDESVREVILQALRNYNAIPETYNQKKKQ